MLRSGQRLTVERLERRDLLAAGALDTTFGSNSIAEYGIPVIADTIDRAIATVSDSQGRVVMGGNTTIGRGRVAVLVRYAQNGSLDDTFNDDGIFFFPLTGEFGTLRDLAMDSDGSIYILAQGADSGASSTLVAKVRDDGTLDQNFGIDGVLDTGGNGKLLTVAPNGDLLIAGTNKIERFRANGSRVREFGDLGTVTTYFNGTYPFAYPEELLVLPDGSLIIAATDAFSSAGTKTDLHFLKYSSDGTRDMTFGSSGSLELNVITTNSPGSVYFQGRPVHLIVTPDERILIATQHVERTSVGSQYDFLLAKITADGEFDNSFSSDGELRLHFDGFASVAGVRLAADGAVLVGGTVVGATRDSAVIVKLSSEGKFDATFGDGGVAELVVDGLQFGSERETRNGLVALPNEGIAIALTGMDDFRLAAFTATGAKSTAYGEDGEIKTNIASSLMHASPQSVIELEDGTLLALVVKKSGYRSDYGLLRIWADGVLDTNYGEAGEYDLTYLRTDLERRTQSARLAKGRDGVFVLFAGYGELTVGSFDEDGGLNSNFGTDGWAMFQFADDFIELQDVIVTDGGRLRVFASGWDTGDHIGIGIDEAGAIDTSFADQGYLRIPSQQYGGAGIAACGAASGHVTLLHASPDDGSGAEIVLERFHADGRKDVSFGDDGRATVPLSQSAGDRHIVCDADDGIVIAGAHRESVRDNYGTRIVRFNYAGQIDTSFGNNGIVDLETTNLSDLPKTIQLDGKGRVVVGLESRAASTDLAVVRFNSDGSRDSSFGINGIVQLDVHGYGDHLASALVAQNEDIILAGSAQTTTDTNLVMARVMGDRDGHPAWQNPTLASDVNGDGTVAPVDALVVINELNAKGPRMLPLYRIARVNTGFLDVSGDGELSPVDVLIVVNRLNGAIGGEGEFSSALTDYLHPLCNDEAPRANGATSVDAVACRPMSSVAGMTEDARDRIVYPQHRITNGAAVDELLSQIDITSELLQVDEVKQA